MISKKRIEYLKDFGYYLEKDKESGECWITLMDVAITADDRYFFYDKIFKNEQDAWNVTNHWHKTVLAPRYRKSIHYDEMMDDSI